MIPLGISLNPVLLKQLENIFYSNFTDEFLSTKGAPIMVHLRTIKSCSKIKNNSVLMYNTSLYNMFLLFILRINRNKVYFHLHDPIPHSGILNPIIFLINQTIVLLSNKILVFSINLKNQTRKYYLNKNIIIVQHGSPVFKYSKTHIKKESQVTIGIIGRYMPYKGYINYIDFIKQNKDYKFYSIGKGYPKSSLENLNSIAGYIPDDQYYSYVSDLDYVFFGYMDISYSGVLNDCIALNKNILFTGRSLELIKKAGIEINECNLFCLDDKLTKTQNLSVKDHKSWKDYLKFI